MLNFYTYLDIFDYLSTNIDEIRYLNEEELFYLFCCNIQKYFSWRLETFT